MIAEAYQRTLALLTDKKEQVEKLAKAYLEREVLHKSDVEELIGNRPYEEKTTLDVPVESETFAPSETTVVSPTDNTTNVSGEALNDDTIDHANATISAADASENNE
jgi:cell division protease FtsH